YATGASRSGYCIKAGRGRQGRARGRRPLATAPDPAIIKPLPTTTRPEEPPLSRSLNRRRFLQSSAALAASAALADALPAGQQQRPRADRLRLGIIGVAGQGAYNLSNVAHEEIVALCDVDEGRAGPARKRFPRARFHQDFRRLLDQKGVQAVVISTPDHTH